MSVSNIWYQYQNETDAGEYAEELFWEIKQGIKTNLIEYKAVYDTFFVIKHEGNKARDEYTEQVQEKLEKLLKENNFIYKIEREENNINLIIFLLEISDEQYEEIDKQQAKIDKMYEDKLFWYGMIPLGLTFLIPMFCSQYIEFFKNEVYTRGLLMAVMAVSFSIYYYVCFKILHKKYDIIVSLDNYKKEQKRIFCTEKSDLKDILKKERKYRHLLVDM